MVQAPLWVPGIDTMEVLVDGEAQDHESRTEFYHIIQNEADRLGRLIDNMLNISRIEAGIVYVPEDRGRQGAITALQRAPGTSSVVTAMAKAKGRSRGSAGPVIASAHRVAPRRRIGAGDVMFELPLDIGQQGRGAEAEQVGPQPAVAEFLLQIGHVAALDASISGSGDVSIGDAPGGIVFRSSANGDLSAGSVSSLDVTLNGSGDAEIARVEGPVSITLSAGGGVEIGEGYAARFTVRTTGSGDVDFGGRANSPDIVITGGGDVRAGSVDGSVSLRATGSGDFTTGG